MAPLPYGVIHSYYNGSLQTCSPSNTFQSIDPSTALPLADIQTTAPPVIDAAIASAKAAFLSWSTTSATERSRVLYRAATILRSNNEDLARTETRDTGKPYSETSTVDVTTGADVLEYYANLVGGGGLNGETIRLRENAWAYTTKEPLGVCVGIGAWNYPLQIALWKSAPCLAAGNCMVYKPSEFTPLHGTRLAEIYAEAGAPPGVFNVVYGDGVTGAYLTSHPDVAKVSFTGQVSTGMKVAASAAGNMKYVTMELGGKSPLLILPDADLDNAVDGAMMANFYSSGQVCTNGTRVFVHRGMKSEFEDLLLKKMSYIRAGDLMDMNTNFGPLVSRAHFEKVMSYVVHGVEQDKAKLLYGGTDKLQMPLSFHNGFWMKPVIFTDCTDDMKIVKEEIFGPVLTILSYDTVHEAVERANNTSLGLAGGIFTKDLNLAHSIAAQLDAGITWVNTWGESPAEMSVGGWKHSGVGVENGRRGIENWVRNKSTLIDMSGVVATAFTKEA